MTNTNKPVRPLRPERPNLMMASERALSLKEQIALITPRWVKRLLRRDRPS
jgi:hypothetical protein